MSTAPDQLGEKRQADTGFVLVEPPMLPEAEAAFRRDIDALLAGHDREWVAYQGSRLLVVKPSKPEAKAWCHTEGFDRSDVLIRCVLPIALDGVDHEEMIDR